MSEIKPCYLCQGTGKTMKLFHAGIMGYVDCEVCDGEGTIRPPKHQAEINRLREALSWFLTDERFSVAVAGNPNVVERMLADARAALEGKAK